MMNVNNWQAAMRETGIAWHYRSRKNLESVIQALCLEEPMVQTENQETPVSLDRYLVTIREITSVDTHFTGTPPFNIWTHLPLALTKYYEQFDLTQEQARKALERFESYTWSKEPFVKDVYYSALKRVNDYARGKSRIWNTYEEQKTPFLQRTIDAVSAQFKECPSTQTLVAYKEPIATLENTIFQIPADDLWNLFTISGWKRMRKRDDMIDEYDPKIKDVAQSLLIPLTAIGKEYRVIYQKREGKAYTDNKPKDTVLIS